MQQAKVRLALAGLLFFVGASVFAQEGDTAEIDQVRQTWMDLYNEGDMAALSDLYTEDGRYYASTGEVAEGRQALQEAFQQDLDLVTETAGGATLQITTEPTETEVFGDVAHEVGTFAVTSEDGRTINSGHYIAILRREVGGWQIAHHMGSDSMLGQMLQGPSEEGDDAPEGGGGDG